MSVLKRMTDAAWKQIVQRLEAAFSVGGKDALHSMKGPEVYALYAQKMCDLNAISKKLAEFPHDELSQLRKAMLERDASTIAGFLKEKSGKERDRGGPDMER